MKENKLWWRETVRVLLNFSRAIRTVELHADLSDVLVRSDNTCTVSENRLSLGPRGGIVIGS